ncbi:alanyl-tRNA synthetase [Alkalibaculum bacchi]|uniref:Alanine--tRNA ligase n=1 Tax=Alkalibaculum bacchi TaxID=645887 RepID=A0A366IC95_9FIRM|nr:alanine--tRNA ligase [Alkalibaculum bacchi]RBP68395.1 alanyl-tRNA synthetase [Alkalibaculum bacchi]
MKKLGLNEIREMYLKFFEEKGHLRMQSAPLVPINDNSLLLINSGMAPLKPYFTGDEVPPSKRVATCQKCIRTPDIDNVGKTARHGTFFEMLGNFSFGDYFKREAIPWAWQFVTEVLEIPEDRLYASIYEDDDEAFEIWHKEVGISADHIVRLGKEDNFWEHGVGPCGPCSELYYDRGIEHGCGDPNCAVGCECDRFIEFWNLVFTQFDKDEQGNYKPLANPNIDTGMGLERMATIMQDVNTIFEVDTIKHVLDTICGLANVTYQKDEKIDVSIRVITDHIRSVTFMVADGVLPSNEGRGYVLRRLLRRAARHGKLLGIDGLFLHPLAAEVAKVSGDAYPELREKLEYITKVIRIEEEKFQETIDQGLILLEDEMKELKAKGEKELSGQAAFKLYDTFGFPLDLTKDILGESGLTVNEDSFNQEMKKQKERARSARLDKDISAWSDDPFEYLDQSVLTEFVGYNTLQNESPIIAMVKEGQPCEEATAGEEVLVLLKETPFYAESGGQIGDYGQIKTQTGVIQVIDCKKGSLARHIHYGKVTEGTVKVQQMATNSVDRSRRLSIARNHTSTHLLQKALREVLGDHVAQAGSLVDEKRLRFDFNHFEKLTDEELSAVEQKVNEVVFHSPQVTVFETNMDKAKELGAMALFGEKYGEIVRVVKVGDYSTELCGGTHLENASQVGIFKIISEAGVASGIRRIEAVTGNNAYLYTNTIEEKLKSVAAILKANPDNVEQKIEDTLANVKALEKELEALRKKMNSDSIGEFIDQAIEINGVKTIIASVDSMPMNDLRDLGDKLRDKLQSGIVLLGAKSEDKVNFVAMGSKDVVGKGFHAGKLIKEVATIAGGGGGGRPDMAQAGGKKPEALEKALGVAKEVIEKQIIS